MLTAELATNYFNLRSTDIELDVLMRSIALQRRALGLISARHDLGAVSGLEVAQQQTLLDTTLVQVDLLRRQRSVFEHAIARKLLEMSAARYEGGASGYLDVITAQQALLSSERLAAQLRGQRLLASVFLVKALGGDWERAPAIATR